MLPDDDWLQWRQDDYTGGRLLGTLIRHANRGSPGATIAALTIFMICRSVLRLQVSAGCLTPLLSLRRPPAFVAAVLMSSVTGLADEKSSLAPLALLVPKDDLAFLFHSRNDGIGQNAWKVGKSSPFYVWALPAEESAGPPGVAASGGLFPLPDILSETSIGR